MLNTLLPRCSCQVLNKNVRISACSAADQGAPAARGDGVAGAAVVVSGVVASGCAVVGGGVEGLDSVGFGVGSEVGKGVDVAGRGSV